MILQLPSCRSRWRQAVALLALCATASSQAIDTLKTPSLGMPSEIIGTWEVVSVHVDTGATRTPHYRLDDFRLTGRIFSISFENITSNTPERPDCKSPGIAASLPVARLIESSMSGRATPPVTPTADDYRLPLPIEPNALAFTVKCNGDIWNPSLGREGGTQGSWLLRLANDSLALRWYDETILELKRMPQVVRPRPSFDCVKALIDSERAICSSVRLAKLDVSIAQSYVAAAREMQEAKLQKSLTTLKTQQRAWLLQRNRCKANIICLEKAMSARLDAIERMTRFE